MNVLAKCLVWGLKLKLSARNGPSGREERQKKRQRERKEYLLNEANFVDCLVSPFQIRHNLLYRAMDPLNLGYGEVDEHLRVEEGGKGDPPISGSSPEGTEGRIFHLLANCFQARGNVKYFKNIIQKDRYDQDASLLIGRRQRNIFEQDEDREDYPGPGKNMIQQTRLRQIESGSIFERFILLATHQANFNNLSKARVSIFSLNVHILGLEEKLRKLQMTCNSCNLIRAQRSRLDDLLQNDRMGPSSQLYRVTQWQKGKTYHMIDLAGPASTYIGNSQNRKKFYIFLGLQLPLKQITCIPIRDYSSQSVYLGLLEYAAKVGGRLDIVASDSGSQFGPFQNSAMVYDEIKVLKLHFMTIYIAIPMPMQRHRVIVTQSQLRLAPLPSPPPPLGSHRSPFGPQF